MSACGMSGDHQPFLVLVPQRKTARADLPNDGCDAHARAQVITGNRDIDSLRIEALGHVAELRRFERAPPAAVNEHGQRCAGMRIGTGEEIVELPRAVAVLDAELHALAARLLAIRFGLAIPPRE